MSQDRNIARAALVALSVCLALVVAACGGSSSGSSTGSTQAAAKSSDVSAPADLVQGGKLTLGGNFTFPPIDYLEGTTKKGFDPDLSVLLGRELGLAPTFVDTQFDSLIPGLEAKKYDAILAGLYVTAVRAKQVDFIPYFDTGNVLVVKRGGSYQPKTPQDICGHTLAVQRGSYVESVAQGALGAQCKKLGRPIDVRSFPDDTQTAQEVSAGRADVSLTDTAVAAYRNQTRPELGLEVSSAPGQLFYPTPVGIAVRKGDTAMRDAITAALDKLKASGEYGALLKRYALAPVDEALVQRTLSATS